MQGLSSLCIAAVVLSMLAPSSAVAVPNGMMAPAPNKNEKAQLRDTTNMMADMKYTDESEAEDFFDKNVEQAMEQEDTGFEGENEAVIEKDELEEAQVEGLSNYESEAVVETEEEAVVETKEEAPVQLIHYYTGAPGLAALYRYWKRSGTDHFYTVNPYKIGTILHGYRGRYNYVSEGITILLYTHRVHGSVPLYRYWRASKVDHFYTTNRHEIGTTVPGRVGKHGYRSEGIVGYCFPSYRKGTVPLYRYWKSRGRDHFYTTNCAEIGTTHPGGVGKHGYKSEGITCFGIMHYQ